MGALLGGAGFIDDAHDFVVAIFDADGGLQRVLVGEEFADEALGDDANVALEALVGVAEKAAGDDVDILNESVGGEGADDLTGFLIAVEADVFANDAQGNNPLNPRNGVLNSSDVLVGDAVFDGEGFAAGVLLVVLGWLDAVDDDVLAAEALDAFLRFEGSAFSDREHRDDGANPEDDPQHGEARAQLVQQEALDAKLDGVEKVGRNHGLLPGLELMTSRSMRPSFMWMTRWAW